MLLLTVLLAVFRWESGGVMDGHDAKIHSDQCSGNAGRLSRTVPDWSEGDSTESQWLDANIFFFSSQIIFVQNSQQSLQICWQIHSLGSGVHRLTEENLFGLGKLRCTPSLGWAEWSSCPVPWSCTQCPHWAGWLNGTPVSPWSAHKLNPCPLYSSTGFFFLIPSGSQRGLVQLCPSV